MNENSGSRSEVCQGDEALLRISDLSVSFGGLVALDSVSFEVPRGGVVGLIGPNGAGKTTCFNAVTGTVAASGSVLLAGQELLGLRPDRVARLGVARTFQHVAVAPELTVLENVRVGAYRHGRAGWFRGGLKFGTGAEERDAVLRAEAAVEALRLQRVAHRLCSELGLPNLKSVEIARAAAFGAELLLLDEPANGLTHGEVDNLAQSIRELRLAQDLTIVVVEHHMGLVRGITSKLVVLDFGRVIATGEPHAVLSSSTVVEAYLGGGAA